MILIYKNKKIILLLIFYLASLLSIVLANNYDYRKVKNLHVIEILSNESQKYINDIKKNNNFPEIVLGTNNILLIISKSSLKKSKKNVELVFPFFDKNNTVLAELFFSTNLLFKNKKSIFDFFVLSQENIEINFNLLSYCAFYNPRHVFETSKYRDDIYKFLEKNENSAFENIYLYKDGVFCLLAQDFFNKKNKLINKNLYFIENYEIPKKLEKNDLRMLKYGA